MSYSVFGVHLPNGDMDIDHWVDLFGDGSYTVLHGQASCLRRLRERAPSALVLVRCYLPNWYAVDPAWWAGECARIYGGVKGYTRHITWANEQNLALESAGAIGATESRRATRRDYEVIHDWNLRFLAAWRTEPGTADAILHYPAFASGHSDDQDDDGFVGLDICRPGIDLCPVLDRHIYFVPGVPILDPWLGIGRLVLTTELFPGKPIFVSESGNFAVTDPRSPNQYVAAGYAMQRRPEVIGWTPFIADSPDRGHDANNLSRNPAILDALGRAPKAMRPDWAPTDPPKEQPVPAYLTGLDISNNNGAVDLAQAKAAGMLDFVVVKVAEDLVGQPDFYDRFASGYLAQARALRVPIGFYHFIRPSRSSPAESVAVMEEAMRRLGGLQAGDWLAVDCEDEEFFGDLSVWFAEMMALCEQVFGFKPWKYSADWYTSTRNLENEAFAPYPTWWASYQPSLPAPQVGWGPIRMWQYDVTAAGVVPGVPGRCDVNRFFGTVEDLRALGSPLGWVPPIIWSPPVPVDPPAPPPTPAPDPVDSALDGLWQRLDEAEAAVRLARDEVVELKKALGKEAA